jgi:hypothetical protein
MSAPQLHLAPLLSSQVNIKVHVPVPPQHNDAPTHDLLAEVTAAQAHLAPHARLLPLSTRKEVATQLVASIKGGGVAALVDLVACRVGELTFLIEV